MRALLLLFLTASCLADTVTMKDGTFLKGRIERIVDGVMEFRAPSLGAANLLRLELAQVESFITDESVRVSAGGVVSDGVASAAGGRVVTRGGRETNTLDQAIELWREPSQRPSETGDTRQWVTQADADLSGRRGVVAGSGFSTGFSAKGVTKADTLIGGVRFMRAEAQDRISADDLHVTLSYETNPTNVLFWYLRTDTGFDNARQIDFFSVNAVGLGFRLFTDAKGKLDARAGLGHRIEIFDDTLEPNRAAPSGDFGLIFTRELGWAAWDTSLNFVPSFQVTGDYYVRHESSLNLLRSSGPLSLRVGLANNFRSKPLPMQVKTDTAYFLRTTYVWK
jgi:hypothetical protein